MQPQRWSEKKTNVHCSLPGFKLPDRTHSISISSFRVINRFTNVGPYPERTKIPPLFEIWMGLRLLILQIMFRRQQYGLVLSKKMCAWHLRIGLILHRDSHMYLLIYETGVDGWMHQHFVYRYYKTVHKVVVQGLSRNIAKISVVEILKTYDKWIKPSW